MNLQVGFAEVISNLIFWGAGYRFQRLWFRGLAFLDLGFLGSETGFGLRILVGLIKSQRLNIIHNGCKCNRLGHGSRKVQPPFVQRLYLSMFG